MSRRQQHFATIQKNTEADDTFRDIAGGWQDVKTVMVQFLPIAGREYIQLQQTEAQTTHRVRMNYRSDVNPKMRLRMARPGIDEIDQENDSHFRIFHIESVINVNEANRELELMVKEQV